MQRPLSEHHATTALFLFLYFKAIPTLPIITAGPAVDVGVTMYVLSISSLSEVEMVQKRAEINHDACITA